jgi:hypothetical protein
VFDKLRLTGGVTRSAFPEGKQHRIDLRVGARSGLTKDNPAVVRTRDSTKHRRFFRVFPDNPSTVQAGANCDQRRSTPREPGDSNVFCGCAP